MNHYGGLFIGRCAAEVLGDYGIGPNHTLPTSGTARYTGGLCVNDFLRIRTWMRVDDKKEAQVAVEDAVRLARIDEASRATRARRSTVWVGTSPRPRRRRSSRGGDGDPDGAGARAN